MGLIGGLISTITPIALLWLFLTALVFHLMRFSKEEEWSYAFLYACFIVLLFQVLTLPIRMNGIVSIETINRLATSSVLPFVIPASLVVLSGLLYISRRRNDNRLKVIVLLLTAFIVVITSFTSAGPIFGTMMSYSKTSSEGSSMLSASIVGFSLGISIILFFFAKLSQWISRKFLARAV